MATEWYKDFYLVTPDGEKQMRKAIADDQTGNVLSDIKQRLNEMDGVPSGRCAITEAQVRFLKRVLGSL